MPFAMKSAHYAVISSLPRTHNATDSLEITRNRKLKLIKSDQSMNEFLPTLQFNGRVNLMEFNLYFTSESDQVC